MKYIVALLILICPVVAYSQTAPLQIERSQCVNGGVPTYINGSWYCSSSPGTFAEQGNTRFYSHTEATASPADFDPLCDGSQASHDCTWALQQALAVVRNGQSVNVHLMAGNYIIKKQITVSAGQCLYGDGRGITTINIDSTFDPNAASVVALSGTEQQGPCIHDIDFEFSQPTDQTSRANFKTLAAGCTTGTGGTGCKYPWVIDLTGSNRARIWNVRIAGAWDGIGSPASTNSGGAWFTNIEMGALDKGLYLSGPLDYVHIRGWESYPYGISGTTLTDVYDDGTTSAATLESVNSLSADGFTTYHANLDIIGSGVVASFVDLQLDQSQLNVSNSNWVTISGGYIGGNTGAAINVSGGRTYISNMFVTAAANQPDVTITGGHLGLDDLTLWQQGGQTNQTMVSSSGSGITFTMKNTILAGGTFNDGTTNVIDDTSDTNSHLSLSGNYFPNSNSTNVGISIATDGSGKSVYGNTLRGFSASLGFNTALGYYDFPGVPFAITLTPTFSTTGDFAPTGNTVAGHFFRKGDFVDFEFSDTFTTNAYTTAAGTFTLQSNMPNIVESLQGCSWRYIDNATIAYYPACNIVSGAGGAASIAMQKISSGGAHSGFGTTEVPPSKANAAFAASGRYRVR